MKLYNFKLNCFRLQTKTLKMKPAPFLSIVLLFLLTTIYSQNKSEKITTQDGEHYITTSIDYPISGTYLFEGDKEPIVQLNPDGLGIFQQHDLSKANISWGIECFENGVPMYKKGFNYAVYTLWYKNKEANTTTDTTGNWINAHFSIHFEKKKMFILGERSKEYADNQ